MLKLNNTPVCGLGELNSHLADALYTSSLDSVVFSFEEKKGEKGALLRSVKKKKMVLFGWVL